MLSSPHIVWFLSCYYKHASMLLPLTASLFYGFCKCVDSVTRFCPHTARVCHSEAKDDIVSILLTRVGGSYHSVIEFLKVATAIQK